MSDVTGSCLCPALVGQMRSDVLDYLEETAAEDTVANCCFEVELWTIVMNSSVKVSALSYRTSSSKNAQLALSCCKYLPLHCYFRDSANFSCFFWYFTHDFQHKLCLIYHPACSNCNQRVKFCDSTRGVGKSSTSLVLMVVMMRLWLDVESFDVRAFFLQRRAWSGIP